RPGMPGFQYVYMLLSECGKHRYVGCTEDLQKRLLKHNKGDVPHTSKFRPWRIETAIAFRDAQKAAAFERYLKSHSGRSFASKHF
ncbi:GIY-YIG nuclease family protein, partial [Coraliomargarita sp. SDUM461003]